VSEGVRYRRAPSVLSRTVGSEVLLTADDSAELRSLDGSAAIVWQFLIGPASAHQLTRLTAEAYGVAPATIAADVEALLADLESTGLAERVD